MSNTEENAPTTDEVRREWVQLRADGYALVIDDADSVAGAEFDRWLAGVKAETLRDAARFIEDHLDIDGSLHVQDGDGWRQPWPHDWMREQADELNPPTP